MSVRRGALAIIIAVLAMVVLGVTGLRLVAPTELQWRMQVLEAKLRGDVSEIPMRQLVTWLGAGSPVYLQPLADNLNPHAAIRNTFTGADDAAAGKTLYLKHCSQCHGDGGHGHAGPDLLDAVANRSDWSFFSTVLWGRPATAMQAQPLSEAQIWQVHAFLRRESLAALGQKGEEGGARSPRAPVDVTPQTVLDADAHPDQWLTYAGNYAGHRHSPLSEITGGNVAGLHVAWAAQLRQVDRDLQVSPIIAGGVMYVSESRDGVVALDARTGAVLWTYRRQIPDVISACCGMPNRGVAVMGRTVYVATIDAHLVALDADTGRERWIVKVADYRDGTTMTGAPLALPDRVVVGMAGGEYGVRGFLAAYDPADGRLLWKFDTIPGPGDPGHETWTGDAWKTGGGSTWTVGAYDPKEDLLFWGTGNPSPEFLASARPGDNLYTNSVIALEAKTGRLRWHYQFTPADEHDWDSNQQPMLAEIDWDGQRRPVVLWANRNGFFYVLDRRSGEFLLAEPFVKQTWNDGFDAKGRPHVSPGARPSAAGAVVWPAIMAATNWWPPSYDAGRGLVFVPCSDAAGVYFQAEDVKYTKGGRFEGSTAAHYAQNLPATAYVKALDVRSGKVRWQTVLASGTENFVWTVGGVLSTEGGVAFAGYRDFFHAFDSDTGGELWKINLGARVRGSPVAYAVGGREHIAVAAGHTIFAFALDRPLRSR